MARSFTVSRRKAALFLAGSVATSFAPAAAAVKGMPQLLAPSNGNVRTMHRQIAQLMLRVRRSNGISERSRAFARCAAAVRGLGTNGIASLTAAAKRSDGATALYRPVDPTLVLATVIVRELEMWPAHDAAWLQRFSDLEAAFAMHVTEHAA